jgi:hypothetical protein
MNGTLPSGEHASISSFALPVAANTSSNGSPFSSNAIFTLL